MASLGAPKLIWEGEGLDPGRREVSLPAPLPDIGDDFDWNLRDYESFRRFMWEELQARFPERQRWTPGDMEAVLVEVLAAALDQLSDMADRVAAESYLETARRFESFRGWLRFIGYDPLRERGMTEEKFNQKKLEDLYRDQPQEMARDRQRAPTSIRRQRRMASLDDYGEKLQEHPLVLRARASQVWGGAWPVVWVTVALWNDWQLDKSLDPTKETELPPLRRQAIDDFHKRHTLRSPPWAPQRETRGPPTIRELLYDYIRRYRMVGQEVFLRDVVPVGINIALRIHVHRNYFQSEVKREVQRVMGRGPDGFFRPGHLGFGQDLQLSDIYQLLMPLDGVDNVRLERFRRTTETETGPAFHQTIELRPEEVAVCDPKRKERGSLEIALEGGRPG